MATLFRFIEPVISFLNAVVVLASLEVLSLVLFVRPRPLWAFREYLPAKRAAGCCNLMFETFFERDCGHWNLFQDRTTP